MTKSRGIRARRGSRLLWVAENQGRHFCECGCGNPVSLRPEYYPNAPRFVHGHNPTRTPRERPLPAPCECGCGELATPGRRFVTGHNGRGTTRSLETREKMRAAASGERNPMYGRTAPNRKPAKPRLPCECGCGEPASPGRLYISGHNMLGSRLSNYTGWYTSHGYVYIDRPEHPFAHRDGYVPAHRLVVEEHLRETEPDSPHLMLLDGQLYLRPEIVVHHVDGIKANNAPSNLAAMTSGEHVALHHAQGDIHG